MGSSQYACWDYLQQHGTATSRAIASDPDNDLTKFNARIALTRLADSGAIKRINQRARKHNKLTVYEIADPELAPHKPVTLEV